MLDRFESALRRAADRLTAAGSPERLRCAVNYALFPPGHRFRPRLCYAVAEANGDRYPWITDAAGVALELIHTASLVQDDLPAFDNGTERRGRPTVHRQFGESTAILAADALILGSFEHLALAVASSPYTVIELTIILARAAGMPSGAVAGQAWEDEPGFGMHQYHQQKTAALFEASTMMGALASGADPEPWRELGRIIGLAYQLADDLHDAEEDEQNPGARTVPNAASEFGTAQTRRLLDARLGDALEAIPPCEAPNRLRAFLRGVGRSLKRESTPAIALVGSGTVV